jgi:hypothetical protein
VKIRHYYHCYAAGAWSAPARDHFTALGRAGLDDTVTTVGLIGPDRDRAMARERITELSAKWALPQPRAWAEAEHGWEQLTLQVIWEDARNSGGEYAVLYMHTKGAANDLDSSASWRRSMTRALVNGWEENVGHLERGYDAVGSHWVKSPEWPEQEPFFAGNFWWARASYLRTLEPPLNETRWQAETWLSLGKPKVHDLMPWWPDYG